VGQLHAELGPVEFRDGTPDKVYNADEEIEIHTFEVRLV